MTEESNATLDKHIGNDSVPSLSHDQPSKEELSPGVTKKPDAQRVKFSARIIQYPIDELKIFEKDSVIGCGSFGRVRKYHHKDKTVAVKEFSITGNDETISNIWNMVQHETNILCRFHHENIVEIQGITQWPNGIGIIMEYIDGGNLQKLLSDDNQSKLSWKTRLDIANGITSGLDYIHNYDETNTFCHGDLKPANVLLTQSLQVKLADFGAAALHRATAASTTTIGHVSTTQFTLIYVAPEFLQDNTRERNPAMDMYSFGLVLYELISRREPYSNSTMPMHVPALIMAKIKPSMKLIDNAESELETDDDRAAFSYLKKLMQRCWNNDPNSRPSSKTAKMDLNNFLMKQSKGSSSQIYGNQNSGAEVAATEREKASETYSTRGTSSGESTLEDIFKLLSRDLPGNVFVRKETSENPFHVSVAPVSIGNREAVQDLLSKYRDSLLIHDYEQADSFKATLRSLIANDVNAEPESLLVFARKIKRQKMYLQSVAIFDTAAVIYAKLKDPEEDLQNIHLCVQGMKSAVRKMTDEDSNIKVIAREHVLPIMRNWLHEMKNASQVSEKWLCHTMSWTLYHIGLSETRVDQWEESKQTLEEAVSEMRRVFGDDAHNQHGRLFGTILNELGKIYKRESRFEEATAFFEESMKAHQEGFDYFGSEEERKRRFEISETNLKSVSTEI